MLRSRVRGLGLIAAIAAVVNLAAIAPAQAAGTGSISGQITDATGAPSVSTNLFVSNENGTSFGYANTDGSGRFTIANLQPGRFTVQFTTSWRGVHNYAGRVEVAADATTTLDYALPATGAVSGRLTRADGTSAAGFQVSVRDHAQQVTTDSNGDWRFDRVFAGDTTVTFSNWQEHIQQYAYGQVDQSSASVITIQPGQTTVVNDSLLPTGSLRVTAVDSVTGAPITQFFAYIRMIGGSAQDGAVVLTGIPAGTHQLGISLAHYVDQDIKQVTIVAGQQTEVQVRLVPEALIQATVVDAATGLPVPGVCVAAVSRTRVPSEGCGPVSDEQGRVTVDYLPAGDYKLLAVPQEAAGYGAQWVGANGGTGRQHRAATVSVRAGQTATAPVIRLDRAGTITGTVRKADGSRPLSYGTVVGLLPAVRSSGEVPPAARGVDENDRYTLDFVGPYDWEVFFTEVTEAAQWSGGVANPLFATTVKVNAGQVSTYNFTFRAAVRVTVSFSGVPAGSYVAAYNSVTGFLVAEESSVGTQATLLLVGPEFVRFLVGNREYDRNFWIPASGSKSFQLAF